jgi:hypothetical protein
MLFIVSTDRLLGKEAKTLPKKILALLAEKWEKLYSEVCGYADGCMNIAIVQATHGPLSTWLLCPNQPDVQPMPPMGGQGRYQSL